MRQAVSRRYSPGGGNPSGQAYTTGTLGTASSTVNYTYGNSAWGDLLTAYNGASITYDSVGNPLSAGIWTCTWKQGRQLGAMSKSGTTWTFTYDAHGMRTKRTNGSTTYTYVYNGSQLSRMTCGSTTLRFTYGADGSPLTVTYNGSTYHYALNLQGDVVAILNDEGGQVVGYTYDAWGRLLSTSGSMASTLGQINPLRYRGYVYDQETGLYYLQSRYYQPAIGRFINADVLVSTGQGILGNNMFAYCGNNPVSRADSMGQFFNTVCGALVGGLISAFTRQEGETFGEAFLRGSVTGAIAGAALDISIVTAGTGAAVAIALAGGAFAASLDYAWEQTNNDTKVTLGGVVTNGIIGGAFNVLFMGAGRTAGRVVGNSIESIGKAMWQNTVKSVTSRAGNFMAKKLASGMIFNTVSASVQSGLGKMFSIVMDGMGVY